MAKGLVWLSEAVSHAMEGHPRWTGHGGEFWQHVVHWRRTWQTTPVFLTREPHEQYKKEILLSHEKNEILSYETGCIDVEGIMLNEMSEGKR